MAKPFNASVPQKLIYDAPHTFIYCKSGVRGGKTRVVLRRIIKEAQEQPGIKILISRTTGPALYSTTLQDFDAECPRELLNLDRCLQKPNPVRTFANGSRVFFVAYEASDLGKLGSEEYGIIVLEEASLFPAGSWEWFLTRLSQQYGEAVGVDGKPYTAKIERTHMISIANSGGRNWLWRVFRRDRPRAYYPWKEIWGYTDRFDVWHPPTKRVEEWDQDPDYFAIEYGTRENKENLRADYWKALQQLPEHLFKRYAEADDEPLEGMVFPNFDRRLHVIPIKGFVPPPHWPVYIGMDYGYRTPTVALWITVTEEGAFVAFREYRQTMKSPSENARNILSINSDLVRRGMQDHKIAWIDLSSGFKKGESESGASVFDQLVASGMTKLSKSSRDLDGRVMRIATLLEPNHLLRKHPVTDKILSSGWPRLFLTEDCEATIREIEEWEWTKTVSESKDPLEKPEMKNDHGIDALGYVLVKVTEKAPLDFDSEKMYEVSKEKEIDDYKRDWCKTIMDDSNTSIGRADGAVY